MKLYLLQHGKALSKEQDPARPLSDEGRHDIQCVADFLHTESNIQTIFHSGKTRAEQTANIIAQKLGVDDIQVHDAVAPNSEVIIFCKHLEHQSEDWILVTHLPYINYLAAHLLNSPPCYQFSPGALMCLEHLGLEWQLNYMLQAKHLHHD